jgi:hypothetical protein
MTARINPDTRPVVIATTGLVAFLGLVSFAVSFAGLVAVAEWAALPPALRWGVPVFVDGALLAYTLAIAVQRARGESTRFSWTALATFTLVSVAANAAHVLGSRDAGDWRTAAGACIASLAPLGILAATHTVTGLAIAPPAADQRGPLVDLTEDQADQAAAPILTLAVRAVQLRSAGMTQRAIADQLQVSKTTVSRWLSAGATREESA